MSAATPPILFLVDGSALAYRSHFAFIRNPLVTSNGDVVSGVFGFASALLRILEMEKPTHLAVVFDAREKTFRHERYAAYKATREKMPDDLVAQLPAIDETVEALSIPLLRVPGFEADDVIGTLARQAADQGLEVRIVSGDKDFFQLVGERVKLFSLGRGQAAAGDLLGPEALKEKFGIRPRQMIDLLALMGDSSDNVPGVPRVGEKTAVELLAQFSTLDNLYEHLDQVKKPALQKNLAENRELAELSRELVTIRTDLDLDLDIDDLARRNPDRARVQEIFQRYEFRSLIPKIPGDLQESATDEEVEYLLVRTDAELEQAIAEMRQAGFFVFDTETTGPDPLRAELVGVALSARKARAWYVPMRPPQGLFGSDDRYLAAARARELLAPLFADPDVTKGAQNAKFDWHVLERAGLPVAGLVFDTMLAHYCVAPSALHHSLDSLALDYFQFTKTPITDLIGRGKSQITMAEVPVERVCEYACEDADYTLRLVDRLKTEMEERRVAALFHEVEVPLIDVLRRMEAAGVALDSDALARMSERFEKRCTELVNRIHELAGETFNVNSTRQLGEVLYERLEIHKQAGLKKIPKTRTGYSTSAAALQPMAHLPIVGQLLEYRQIEKLRGTYVDALPKLLHPDTGRLHTSFNQTVAATGRLSSSDPNLQNIPIRTELGREIRRCFIGSFPDGVLVSADYSQVELRIMAHLSGDPHLEESFRNEEDIHQRTASLIFGVEPGAIDVGMRSRAKAINFGIMYGMGSQRLARETGLSMVEAKEFIDRYFEVFAGVKKYLDRTLADAQDNGYVTTLLGRRRYIPELYSDDRRLQAAAHNIAVNTPIQGTAADLIKKAMIEVDAAIRAQALRSRMILQVHDELVFDVHPDEVEAVQTIARECMEGALELSVPLKVDMGTGPTWLDAH